MSSMSRAAKGFTLIELMVSMALGIVLTGGVATLFLENSTNFAQDNEMARIQENGRYAMRTLARELSMAGFMGRYINVDKVLTTTITDIDQCGDDWAVNFDVHLEHENNILADADLYGGCIAEEDQLAGTDVLVIKRVADTASLVNGELTASTTIDDDLVYLRAVNQGHSMNLVNGSVFSTDDITAGSAVDAWEYRPVIYFVRNYSTVVGDGIPTLCRVVLNGDEDGSGSPDMSTEADEGDCFVEGIENIQIEYGIDSDADGTPNQYSADPADVDNIVSARIYILARSVGSVRNYTNDKVYNLGGVTVAAAGDRFMRKVFSTTVVLRNPYNL